MSLVPCEYCGTKDSSNHRPQCDTVRLEAEAAALREALGNCYAELRAWLDHVGLSTQAERALRSDAGRALLAEVTALRARIAAADNLITAMRARIAVGDQLAEALRERIAAADQVHAETQVVMTAETKFERAAVQVALHTRQVVAAQLAELLAEVMNYDEKGYGTFTSGMVARIQAALDAYVAAYGTSS